MEKKYIYKITNLINNKIYIGQTNNPNRRWKEHRNSNSGCIKLRNAIKKYGSENFIFEIIEGPIINYDEREKYWITQYNSINEGYNIAEGGQTGPIFKGEESFFCLYSDNMVFNICKDLIENKKYIKDIAEEYGVSSSYVSDLNAGKYRKFPELIYPLRKSENITKDEKIIKDICYDLINTYESAGRLAKKYNVSVRVIDKVNSGKHKFCNKVLNYPIRSENSKISNHILQQIRNDLRDDKLKFSEIEKKYNLSKATINRINQGKSYKIEGISYPIRTSKHRVR